MKTTSLAIAATLIAGGALAQTAAPARPTPGDAAPGATSNAPMNGVNPNTGVTPSTGVVDRNSGTAAAAGDRNQAVASTSANAPQPARGANSFSEGEARRRIERTGFQQVTGLRKDSNGVWRGTAKHDGASTPVWLDYKGNVSPGVGTPRADRNARPAVAGRRDPTAPGPTRRTPTGNPPGTAADARDRPQRRHQHQRRQSERHRPSVTGTDTAGAFRAGSVPCTGGRHGHTNDYPIVR